MRKLLSTALIMGVVSSTSMMPAIAISADAIPELGSIRQNASVSFDKQGANNHYADVNVKITGEKGSVGEVDWNSFNVGSNKGVNFEFTAHNQTSINRVHQAGGLSQIYGKITNSGCNGCGYAGTGKIILLNPNGVFFGNGANVDVNSFTVSTMDGTYNEEAKRLDLNRTTTSPYGIRVDNGAKVHGDKNVTFASDNVILYGGSKITTKVNPNAINGVDSYGKVKIVTADGVNFTYYNNGTVKEVGGIKGASQKMIVSVEKDASIDAGHIDIRNYSSNVDSVLNIKGATLKATKAVSGNDGNIWLTASNKILLDGAKLETVNYSEDASANAGGDISIIAGKKASVNKGSTLNAVRDVEVISQNDDAVVQGSTITAGRDIRLTAKNIASVQETSNLTATGNITITGDARAQAQNSQLSANDVNITSKNGMVWTSGATVNAENDINIKSEESYLQLESSQMTANNNVNLTSKSAVSSARLAGSTFTGKNVNVKSTEESINLTSLEQFKPSEKLTLDAKKNIEVVTENNLTVKNTDFKAGKNVTLSSTSGNVNLESSTGFLEAEKIYIKAAQDVTAENPVNMNDIQTNIEAGHDVNVNLEGIGKKENGLIAKAENNMNISTKGTLSVSSLISGKDMTIKANRVIAGLPNTPDENLLPADEDRTSRSYIEVGGKFTSENLEGEENYEITLSGDPDETGSNNRKHHIKYGEEKILLVNKRPIDNNSEDPSLSGEDKGTEANPVGPGSDPGAGGTGSGSGQGGEDPNPNPNPNPNPDPDPDPDPDPNPDDGDCGEDGESDNVGNENSDGRINYSLNGIQNYIALPINTKKPIN